MSGDTSKKIFAFDFDGVLAIPYTDPEELYPAVDGILRGLHAQGHIVIVTSFNPRSYYVLKSYLDEGIIQAIRAGSRSLWWLTGEYADVKHRFDMMKSLHLSDMLRDELASLSLLEAEIYMFDDSEENLSEINRSSFYIPYNVKTFLIDNSIGLTESHIEAILSGATFSGATFTGATFSEATFSEANHESI